MVNEKEIAESYGTYIKTVKGIVASRISGMKDQPYETEAGKFSKSVWTAMDSAGSHICKALESLAGENQDVANALMAELAFFNARYSKFEPDAKTVEDAKTVKDSLEQLLKKWLPEWVKRALKLLNELLSLV